MGPILAAYLLYGGSNFVAFWLFIASIATDLLDGFAARRLGVTDNPMGKWLDPFCDKVLTDSVWLALWWIDFAPGWLACTIVIRDLIVITAWCICRVKGLAWERPSPIGQVAVAFEGVAVSVLLFHGPWLTVHWPSVGVVLGAITLVLTVFALIPYVRWGPTPIQPAG
jgi:CDP-diacylglycerol--glycerol-3-phosphate 3-phosphatidyltransferase